MSGETEKEVSALTPDTLLLLLNERDRRYGERFDAQEKAVHVALEQTKTRFENVNEWRGTVTDLLSNAIPRAEADTRLASTNDKIGSLQSRLDRLEGRTMGVTAFWGVLTVVIVIAIAAIGFLLK